MSNKTEKKLSRFEQEISKLDKKSQDILKLKTKVLDKLLKVIKKSPGNKSVGFAIKPNVGIKNNVPTFDFKKLTLLYLLDDLELEIEEFNCELLLGKNFNKYLIKKEITKNDPMTNQPFTSFEYFLKEDENIKFVGSSVKIFRDQCSDSNYEILKEYGQSIIYEDERGFISALKTIDIHKNMTLQKFEKYVVAYVGAGSWLRAEKSNDFDIFIVVDDTDVKKISRLQVKDQLTKIIWDMSYQVKEITGIQLHIQVYLLTDFWDALKDAHPVMFTFLRDGIPFYDRGIYSAWSELLKLGKIRPSQEAIDMHLNIGTQLLDKAKSTFNELAINDVYNSVLSPSQALLMLKGYNPTTPKETINMFEKVLYKEEKLITKQEFEIVKESILIFKKIELDKNFKLTGKDLDRLILNGEKILKKINSLFTTITGKKTKESIEIAYSELISQIKSLENISKKKDGEILDEFNNLYVKKNKVPQFVKNSISEIKKIFKKTKNLNKVGGIEANKILKDIRIILSEIKILKDNKIISNLKFKKLILNYGKSNKMLELFSYDKVIYIFEVTSKVFYEYKNKKLLKSKIDITKFEDYQKYSNIDLDENLIMELKSELKIKEIRF